MRRTTLGILAFALALPVAAQQADSPLVALAKRTGRLGKMPKAHVITNDDVAASRGRVSDSIADPGLLPPPEQTNAARPPETAPVEHAPAAEAPAAPAPKPRVIEGSSRATYSTPQTTARDATVTSSARSSTGQSTAQSGTVQSTAVSRSMPEAPPTSIPPATVPPKKID